jgi:hypothetical protein
MKKYFYVYQSNYKKQEISRNRRSLFEPSIWQKALLVLSFRENKKTTKSKFGIDDEAVFFFKKKHYTEKILCVKFFFTLN